MGMHKEQLKELIQYVLTSDLQRLNTQSAVQILLGTAAQESRFGYYLKQLGTGPALGIFQMEPFTFHDLQVRFSGRFPVIVDYEEKELRYNLRTAIVMARIKYYSCPGNLPDADDIEGMAKYWKQYYNTPLGKGTTAEFIKNYKEYVL
jgi:hypothetical protein